MAKKRTLLERESSDIGIMIHNHLKLKKRANAAWEIEDALRQPLSPQSAQTAALMMIHALAQTGGDHPPERDEITMHWERILDPGSGLRFRPIVPLALRLIRALPQGSISEEIVMRMTKTARETGESPGMGDMLQDLTPRRKQLAVYHTRPESAALMANLAVPGDRDWSSPEAASEYRIADYACGAGELLVAAYRRERELHRQAGGSPGEVHAAVMQRAITAMDILPASTALAAARLDALEPDPAQPGGATRALSPRCGPIEKRTTSKKQARQAKRAVGLGSVDLLDPVEFQRQDLRPIGRGEAARERLNFPPESQDLVIMNPPYTRTQDPREWDQNVPNPKREILPTKGAELEQMERRMEKIRTRIQAGNGNGFSLHFAHLAHRMVKRGGTIALLLPMSALSAGGGGGETWGNHRPDQGWPSFRRKLIDGYTDIRVIGIAGFEDTDSTFSQDTYIAEAMLVARRTRTGERPDGTGCFITLKKRPEDEDDAAHLARAIERTAGQLREDEPGTVRELAAGSRVEGTVVKAVLPRDDIWSMSRVLDPALVQAMDELRKGRLHVGDGDEMATLPIAALGDIARVGMNGYETARMLGTRAAPESKAFPSLRGHDCETQRTLEIPAPDELHLQPEYERHRKSLDRTISRLHFNNNFRYNSQSTSALTTTEPSIGGQGWLNILPETEMQEKALALWLNTSLGLIAHWTKSNHSQNGLGYLSKKQVRNIQVLDVARLTREQMDLMAETFDRVKGLPLLPANEAWRDRIRAELDRRVLEDVLGLDAGATEWVRFLCNCWCLEPTVQGRKGGVVKRQPDMAELHALANERPAAPRPSRRTPRKESRETGVALEAQPPKPQEERVRGIHPPA